MNTETHASRQGWKKRRLWSFIGHASGGHNDRIIYTPGRFLTHHCTSLDTAPVWTLHQSGHCTSLDTAPVWTLHQSGHCTSLDTAPVWTLHQSGHCTSLDTAPVWTLHQSGHCTSLDTAPVWTLHQSGHCTSLDTAPVWTLHQSGHCTSLDTAPVWTLHQSGHCTSLDTAPVWTLHQSGHCWAAWSGSEVRHSQFDRWRDTFERDFQGVSSFVHRGNTAFRHNVFISHMNNLQKDSFYVQYVFGCLSCLWV